MSLRSKCTSTTSGGRREPRARTRARRASLANLEAHRQRIDDLNVYPVPDGDTGTNLTLTVRSIVEALEASNAEGHEAVAKELSRAALMGARGNSGVIFSQILRGFADVLAERDEVGQRDAGSRVPFRERLRLPGGAASSRGNDADRDPGDGRGG